MPELLIAELSDAILWRKTSPVLTRVAQEHPLYAVESATQRFLGWLTHYRREPLLMEDRRWKWTAALAALIETTDELAAKFAVHGDNLDFRFEVTPEERAHWVRIVRERYGDGPRIHVHSRPAGAA